MAIIMNLLLSVVSVFYTRRVFFFNEIQFVNSESQYLRGKEFDIPDSFTYYSAGLHCCSIVLFPLTLRLLHYINQQHVELKYEKKPVNWKGL